MKVVIDTNILLVSVSPQSDFYWIFEAFPEEKFELCVSSDVLMEYEKILEHHMGEALTQTVLQLIEVAPNTQLITRYYQWRLISQDPDDNKFVDCAVAANAAFLVSHDKHFRVLKEVEFPKLEVISAEEFRRVLEIKN